MTLKQYTISRLSVVVLIAVAVSFLVVQNNYLLAIVVIVTGMAVMYSLKKRVKDVLADERDWHLAGKSAMITLNIYAIVTTFGGFGMLVLSSRYPELKQTANWLFYSVCALLLLNSSIFTYYRRRGDK